MNKATFLDQIRRYELVNYGLVELERLSPLAPNRIVLEIGAGTGQQAKLISSAGYFVIALDMTSSSYKKVRVYPIVEYDGMNFPIKENSISIAFSSNVLEHIKEIDNFFFELNKTFANDSYSIHILPTPAWRLWSNISHYAWVLKKIISFYGARNKSEQNEKKIPASAKSIIRHLIPMRHGERGNFLTETYYFSKHYWEKTFKKNGYDLLDVKSCNLFYTNSNIFGEALPVRVRVLLSYIIGSACNIYVLKKSNQSPQDTK